MWDLPLASARAGCTPQGEQDGWPEGRLFFSLLTQVVSLLLHSDIFSECCVFLVFRIFTRRKEFVFWSWRLRSADRVMPSDCVCACVCVFVCVCVCVCSHLLHVLASTVEISLNVHRAYTEYF